MVITATGATTSANKSINVIVAGNTTTAPPTTLPPLTLTGPDSITTYQGSSGDGIYDLANITEFVHLDVVGLPAGVTASFVGDSFLPRFTLTLTATDTANLGTVQVMLSATGATTLATKLISVTVATTVTGTTTTDPTGTTPTPTPTTDPTGTQTVTTLTTTDPTGTTPTPTTDPTGTQTVTTLTTTDPTGTTPTPTTTTDPTGTQTVTTLTTTDPTGTQTVTTDPTGTTTELICPYGYVISANSGNVASGGQINLSLSCFDPNATTTLTTTTVVTTPSGTTPPPTTGTTNYTLTGAVSGSGTVGLAKKVWPNINDSDPWTSSGSPMDFTNADLLQVTMTPSSGYRLDGWIESRLGTMNTASNPNGQTIQISGLNQSETITAVFSPLVTTTAATQTTATTTRTTTTPPPTTTATTTSWGIQWWGH